MQLMIGFDNDFLVQVDIRKLVYDQNGMFMFCFFIQKIFIDVYM